MRIIAGSARGRVLLTPRTARRIRPTLDRVRETVFNILGQYFEGHAVLDLFAGTGALALEALSRGAARAVMVDSDKEAVELCRSNAQALGFLDRVEILAMPAVRGAKDLVGRGDQFELVFADPPYEARAVISTGEATGPLLKPGGTLCVEHDRREEAPEQIGPLRRVDQRAFGDTRVSFYRA